MLIRPHDAPIVQRARVARSRPRPPVRSPHRTWHGSGVPRCCPHTHPFHGNLTIRLHLARPNPVWPALRENTRCLFVVTAAYVPTSWEAPPGTPAELGIPTKHSATPSTRRSRMPPSSPRSAAFNSRSPTSMPSSSSTAPNRTPCGSRSSTATDAGTHPATARHSLTCADATLRWLLRNSRPRSTLAESHPQVV